MVRCEGVTSGSSTETVGTWWNFMLRKPAMKEDTQKHGARRASLDAEAVAQILGVHKRPDQERKLSNEKHSHSRVTKESHTVRGRVTIGRNRKGSKKHV
jgi:hypothetical protein